jgi:5-(carboxyamino)imidazole ribonucleotide synthase
VTTDERLFSVIWNLVIRNGFGDSGFVIRISKMASTPIILPGSTLGVLGSGQLGRMFAIAARQMGYRVATFSPDDDTPTGQVADVEVVAPYDDLDAVRAFAKNVSVVTFEFENVPAATAAAAAEFAPVRPGGNVLHITQHRLREKTFLREHGFPVAPFHVVRSLEELRLALHRVGYPAVLKTAGWGYDGKGQVKIETPEHADTAWSGLETPEAVLEGFVDFEKEVSLVAARGVDGSFVHWGLIENDHHHHILDTSLYPANANEEIGKKAVELARGILDTLDVVGVLCVEFFLTRDGDLIVNELAPRPHNSGHLTIDACITSQFEQQVRAVTGLPLGSTQMLRPAAMANLLGDLWLFDGKEVAPDWAVALATSPDVKLHLYGKITPRAGRKMGHFTATGATGAEAIAKVRAARAVLNPSGAPVSQGVFA